MSFNTLQTDNEHCMLLALPCGRDEVDVLQQSKNLQTGFIMYLQQKQAAGIVNIAAPGSQQVGCSCTCYCRFLVVPSHLAIILLDVIIPRFIAQ